MSALEEFRRRKDAWLTRSLESPIPPEQRATFQGLAYYPENPNLRLIVRVEEFADQESVLMTTSTGDVQEYTRWGEFHFDVDGQPARLTVYHAAWGGYFVPFADATSGVETYGAGRYLDLEPLEDGTFLADFNLAYNPYCAYSEEYSCPIPPAENRLQAPIRAGEMRYEAAGEHA